jgi:hypothetical protein
VSAQTTKNSTIPALCGALLTLTAGHASAAGCPPIEAATLKQAITPYHMTRRRTDHDETHSEMIQAADTTYALIKGHWRAIPYKAAERVKDLNKFSG